MVKRVTMKLECVEAYSFPWRQRFRQTLFSKPSHHVKKETIKGRITKSVAMEAGPEICWLSTEALGRTGFLTPPTALADKHSSSENSAPSNYSSDEYPSLGRNGSSNHWSGDSMISVESQEGWRSKKGATKGKMEEKGQK